MSLTDFHFQPVWYVANWFFFFLFFSVPAIFLIPACRGPELGFFLNSYILSQRDKGVAQLAQENKQRSQDQSEREISGAAVAVRERLSSVSTQSKQPPRPSSIANVPKYLVQRKTPPKKRISMWPWQEGRTSYVGGSFAGKEINHVYTENVQKREDKNEIRMQTHTHTQSVGDWAVGKILRADVHTVVQRFPSRDCIRSVGCIHIHTSLERKKGEKERELYGEKNGGFACRFFSFSFLFIYFILFLCWKCRRARLLPLCPICVSLYNFSGLPL